MRAEALRIGRFAASPDQTWRTALAVTAPVPDGIDRDRVRAQLKIWGEHLIDLTARNPLLGINRSRTSKLRVSAPSGSSLFSALILTGKELRLPHVRSVPRRSQAAGDEEPLEESLQDWQVLPGDIDFEATPSDLKRKLRRIRDNARTTVEERGVTTLHLAIGAVQWSDQLLGESVAPILLVPCALKATGVDAPLLLTPTEEDTELNPALALWLRERHKKSLPELPDEVDAEFVATLFKDVRASLGTEWTVTDEVWLSTFSFETLAMCRDLQALGDVAVENTIVQAFARAGTAIESSESLPDDLDALAPVLVTPIAVLPADSSQLEALTHARAGNHLLVHGPPGTGKSQTIANVIADALGQGKTVLFVSAKMAALDVVFNRLSNLGMGRFCLEAHSVQGRQGKGHRRPETHSRGR